MKRKSESEAAAFVGRRHILAVGSLAFMGVACQRRDTSYLPGGVGGIYYRVKKGDTLYHIAQACHMDVAQLMAANRLYVTELEVGQVILLPHLKGVPVELLKSRSAMEEKEAIAFESPMDEPMFKEAAEAPRSGQSLVYVTRQQWGAAPSKSNSSPMGPVKRITLHHTSEYPGMDKLTDMQVIQSIAKYHRSTLGWADIGYHYIVGRDGRVYEGRSSQLQGAHTGGHNENNLGISMMGNYVHQLPSKRQLDALKLLLAEKYQTYGLSAQNLFGHRDFKATECPGAALYRWLMIYKFQA
jgi:N-acetylmuramoyl-L-alanine amidase